MGVLEETDTSRSEQTAVFRDFLKKYVAFDGISQTVAGKYWRRMSESQRSDYNRLSADWSAKTYAIRLGNYQGETVKIDKALPLDSDTVIVRTHVVGTKRNFTVE